MAYSIDKVIKHIDDNLQTLLSNIDYRFEVSPSKNNKDLFGVSVHLPNNTIVTFGISTSIIRDRSYRRAFWDHCSNLIVKEV